MKHLLILFALVSFNVNGDVLAQEQAAETAAETINQAADDSGSRLKLSIDTSDGDERLDEAVDFVSKLNSELGDELKVELEGLSKEEKAELVKEFKDGFHFDSRDSSIPAVGVLVPIVAIVSVFGLPVFLLIVLLTSGHRKRKQKMELVNLYMDNDKELPAHVIKAFDEGGESSSLRSGLTLTGVGLGILAGFSIAGDMTPAGLGLIPMCIGLARLAYWYMEERNLHDKHSSN